jgi:hypothetical protein
MLFQKLKQHRYDFAEVKMTFGIKHKIILFSTLLTFLAFTYDTLPHLLLELLHGLFESVEYILHGCIEHLFETGTHDTQIIVFYILFSIISYGLYRLYRFLPRCYQSCKNSLANDKAQILAYWHSLSLLTRLKYYSFLVIALSCWLFFGF